MKQLSRVLAGVLALALCLWMAPALAESYVVVSSDAHVRSGPGLNYDSLDVMRAGEKAGYLENSSVDSRGVTWYKVNYGGVTGWVSSKYAAVKQGGTNSGFFTGESDSYVKVSGGDAHVRSGPGLNYDSLEVMHAGETAVYLDDSSVDSRGVAWYKVKYDGVTGWVSSKYAKVYEGSAPADTVKVSGGDANLRSGPGLSYEDIGTMHNGETAGYLGSSSVDERGVAWYKVNFNGKVGWVSSKYAKITGEGGGASASGVKVSGGNANLRSGPGLGYEDIGTMHNGETASYLGGSSVDERGVTWYKVNFNGKVGWVSSKYARLY